MRKSSKRPRGAQGGPKGPHGRPKTHQRGPKGPQRTAKWGQRVPKREPKGAKGHPKGAKGHPQGAKRSARAPKREPEGAQSQPQGSQRDKIYISNSRSTAPADVMLCIEILWTPLGHTRCEDSTRALSIHRRPAPRTTHNELSISRTDSHHLNHGHADWIPV